MPVLDCYLFFDGTCAEAMRFYEAHAGRQDGNDDDLRRVARRPRQCPRRVGANRIMHASLTIRRPAASWRRIPRLGQPHSAMNGFALSLNYPNGGRGTTHLQRAGRWRHGDRCRWARLSGPRPLAW